MELINYNISFVLYDINTSRSRNLLDLQLVNHINDEANLMFNFRYKDDISLISDCIFRNHVANTVTYTISFSSKNPNIENLIIKEFQYSFRKYNCVII